MCKASATASSGSFTVRCTRGISARQSGQRRLATARSEITAGSLIRHPRHRLWPHGSPTGRLRIPKQQGHCRRSSRVVPSPSSPFPPCFRKARQSGPVSSRELLTLDAAVSEGIRSPRETEKKYFSAVTTPTPVSSPSSLSSKGSFGTSSISDPSTEAFAASWLGEDLPRGSLC